VLQLTNPVSRGSMDTGSFLTKLTSPSTRNVHPASWYNIFFELLIVTRPISKFPSSAESQGCSVPVYHINSQCQGNLLPEAIPGFQYLSSFVNRCNLFFVSPIVNVDRLCGLVVRVLSYRSGGPGSIPGTTKKSSESGTGSTQPREYN
jgi:hypothetical protein